MSKVEVESRYLVELMECLEILRLMDMRIGLLKESNEVLKRELKVMEKLLEKRKEKSEEVEGMVCDYCGGEIGEVFFRDREIGMLCESCVVVDYEE